MSWSRICPRCFGCGVRRGLRPAQGLRLWVEVLEVRRGLSWARTEPHLVLVPKLRTLEAPENAQPWCSSGVELEAEPDPNFSSLGGSGCSALPPATLIQK